MITLKAALIAASAVGVVSVGGGATWAMTGSHQDAGLQSESSRTTAVHDLKKIAPAPAAPTCLPAKPGVPGAPNVPNVPGAKLPDGRLPDARVPGGAKLPDPKLPNTKVPGGAKLPDAKVPGGTKLPDAKVPGGTKVPGGAKLPEGNLPKPGIAPGDTQKKLPSVPGGKVNVPGGQGLPGKANLPGGTNLPGKGKLPTCLPDAKRTLPKGTSPDTPTARVPAKPGLPAVPAVPGAKGLDCSKLPPAVKIGSPAERAVMLAKGLTYTSSTPVSKALQAKKVCGVTQKWTGKAGQWLTVETLKTPAGMPQTELRKALALPATGGSPVTVGGFVGWQAPGGGGVLLFDPNGYSLFVNGSPVLAGDLQNVAAALRQAK
ncbi:hypothetical protein [Actinomadura terrae]|uniref:hypothetical protein n=1 Tax=Actinomadura terrae TaxID=604353 RepID=UPI001FA6C69A|nr:hypothetical protein [Actinomadura terrae]